MHTMTDRVQIPNWLADFWGQGGVLWSKRPLWCQGWRQGGRRRDGAAPPYLQGSSLWIELIGRSDSDRRRLQDLSAYVGSLARDELGRRCWPPQNRMLALLGLHARRQVFWQGRAALQTAIRGHFLSHYPGCQAGNRAASCCSPMAVVRAGSAPETSRLPMPSRPPSPIRALLRRERDQRASTFTARYG